MRAVKKLVPTIFLLLILFPSSSPAQYPFGKNKIQYHNRDWKVIETEHVDIFYYPDELPIAEFIAYCTEDIYREYADFFKIEFDRQIPVILYGTHHDFKETNVIPYLISEGTGGFTEFIKGRVAVPFTGSYADLKAVYRHEMVHVFMLEKLRLVMKEHHHFTYPHPPLWFTEGLAEYLAHGKPDHEAEMFLRDAVTGDNLYSLQELWRIQGTYLMYKEGESALHFLATSFGDEAIMVILENWWKSDKFDLVLKKSIGLDVREFSYRWEESLKKRYYPSILSRRRVREIAEPMYEQKKWSFENHPICLLDEEGKERYFCLGYGLGSIDLFELVRNRRGEWKRKAVLRGARSSKFESIPLLRSRLSSRGDTLLFVSKVGEMDAIYLYDVGDEKIVGRVSYPQVRIINSPALSPDGNRIVFSAIDRFGKSDLYLYRLAEGSFTRLTDDYFDDTDPDWHPSGHVIVFSSDRLWGEPGSNRALYSLDVNSLELEQLTAGEGEDIDPRYLPGDEGLLFSSDREGIFDIYLLRDGRLYRQTSVLGGAFGPAPCGGGGAFLTAAYSDATYHIYRGRLKVDTPRGNAAFPAPVRTLSWRPETPDTGMVFLKKDYKLKFGIDLIAAAFSVDPDFGYMGNGAQIFLTDILGDHQLVFLLGSASDDFADFWENINAAVTYINKTRRLNYAFGAFHLASYVGSLHNLLRFERRYGVMGGLSYPLSKFSRVDLQSIFKMMKRDDDITYIGLEQGKSLLLSNYLSYTLDNIVWGVGGPLNGHRLNVALGRSLDLQGSRYENSTLSLDVRNYLNIGSRVVFAQRFVSRNAWGSDIQLFYLGGSWDLRGYGFREYAGRRTLLLNNELRFPFIEQLVVRFPFGNIEFPSFRGAIFVDAGKVGGFVYDTDWLGSVGTGVEMNLGYLPVIRVNFSRRTDFRSIDSQLHVDLFLGFNF
ncbi:MAG: PD40 domain-containing protein [Candidatus Krumholzibacteriota bacterium]|nr:PD40 domain-containing protein [Candidatus Krumholzibacteriota bacterium]